MITKKGMRGVALDGKTLRFSHGNVGLFAQDAYDHLLAQDKIGKGANITADYLMSTLLGSEDIMELALFYGLKLEHPDAKLEDMAGIADAWAEAGHSDMELRRKILEAFYLATDPSGVSSLQKRWTRFDQQEEATKKQEEEDREMNEKVEAARIAANTRIKMAKLEEFEKIQTKKDTTPTPSSPDLPASS